MKRKKTRHTPTEYESMVSVKVKKVINHSETFYTFVVLLFNGPKSFQWWFNWMPLGGFSLVALFLLIVCTEMCCCFFCVWIFQHYSWLLQLNILQWNYLKGRFRIMWCRNHDINTSQHVFRTFSLIKNNIWFLNNITTQNNKQLICRSFFLHVNEWAKRITSNYFQKIKCWFDKLVWVIKMK